MSEKKKSVFSISEKIAIIAAFLFVAYLGGSGINWKENYVRAKVSRAKTDLRAIEAALNHYQSNEGILPLDLSSLKHDTSLQLNDPFHQTNEQSPYQYFTDTKNYVLISKGPNTRLEREYDSFDLSMINLALLTYDPSNGTVSAGDIFNVGY